MEPLREKSKMASECANIIQDIKHLLLMQKLKVLASNLMICDLFVMVISFSLAKYYCFSIFNLILIILFII